MNYLCSITQAEKGMLALGSVCSYACMQLIFKTKLKVKPENRISPFAE